LHLNRHFLLSILGFSFDDLRFEWRGELAMPVPKTDDTQPEVPRADPEFTLASRVARPARGTPRP